VFPVVKEGGRLTPSERDGIRVWERVIARCKGIGAEDSGQEKNMGSLVVADLFEPGNDQ